MVTGEIGKKQYQRNRTLHVIRDNTSQMSIGYWPRHPLLKIVSIASSQAGS